MYWGAYGVRLELHTPVACETGSFRMAQIPSKDRPGVADTNTFLTYKTVCSVSEHLLMTTVIHCDFYFPQLILPTIPKNTFQLFMSFETGFFWKVGV